jgi:DNA-binding transcriptional ArsR family regulator
VQPRGQFTVERRHTRAIQTGPRRVTDGDPSKGVGQRGGHAVKRSVESLSLSLGESLSHGDQVQRALRSTDTLDLLAAVHCASRLQLLALLATGPATVTELVAKTELSMQLVSSHLNKLKALGVLSCDTEGRQRVYWLTASGSVRHGHHGLELNLSAPDGSTLRLGIPNDSPVSRLIRGSSSGVNMAHAPTAREPGPSTKVEPKPTPRHQQATPSASPKPALRPAALKMSQPTPPVAAPQS